MGGADIYLWAAQTSIYGRSGHTKLQDHFIDLVAEWDGLKLFYLLMSGAEIYLWAEQANKLGSIGIITSIYGRSGHVNQTGLFY